MMPFEWPHYLLAVNVLMGQSRSNLIDKDDFR
jgi:hypothetical protein